MAKQTDVLNATVMQVDFASLVDEDLVDVSPVKQVKWHSSRPWAMVSFADAAIAQHLLPDKPPFDVVGGLTVLDWGPGGDSKSVGVRLSSRVPDTHFHFCFHDWLNPDFLADLASNRSCATTC